MKLIDHTVFTSPTMECHMVIESAKIPHANKVAGLLLLLAGVIMIVPAFFAGESQTAATTGIGIVFAVLGIVFLGRQKNQPDPEA